jgi:hypothetical protein
MADAPPLAHFALGALYQRAGDHDAAIEHLAYVVETETGDEQHCISPSPELRRYVRVLRRLERDPSEGPQTLAAVRNLERTRRAQVATLLEESRKLSVAAKLDATTAAAAVAAGRDSYPSAAPSTPHEDAPLRLPLAANTNAPHPLSPPPKPAPISEVLRDLYEEEKKTA